MRASRLIKMVLLLQTRRTMTAAELATELEVSERTVARDALALSEAGVPVYADRGRTGGYRLVGGYRTGLTGIGRGEAEALFLSGVPSALRDMGLADTASAARLKVSAALLPGLRDAEHSAAQRFHLDAPGWWQSPRKPPVLPTLADAVWDDRRVTARYRRKPADEVERELEPYGLVLKAGSWYVVARAAGGEGSRGGGGGDVCGGGAWRVYRADRFTEVTVRDERFARDEDFDLPGFWEERAAAFARSILREEVVLRLSAEGARQLRYVTDRVAADEALAKARADTAPDPATHTGTDARTDSGTGTDARTESGTGTGTGTGSHTAVECADVTVTLPVESVDVAYAQLLALGPECEVLQPPALRDRLGEAALRMAALYGTPGTPPRCRAEGGPDGGTPASDGAHNVRTEPGR